MQSLILEKELKFIAETPPPVLYKGEAMIRVHLAGICATDLELVKGYASFVGIPGHEFVGTVVDVKNDEDHHWLNRRVVASINIGCRNCPMCKRYGAKHCLNRGVLGIRKKDGVFADFFTLPTENLFAVPDAIEDQAAVFAEPLAAAIQVVKQIQDIPLNKIAVIGPGRLGLLIAKVLELSGYQIDVVGRSESSLNLPRKWKLKTNLTENVPDDYYECVVDATGNQAGFEQALRVIQPRGTLVLKSTFSASGPIDLSKLVVGEINLIGSRCGPIDDALNWLENQLIDVKSLIDGIYTLKEGIAAFQHASKPGVRKILLFPDQ